MKRYKLCLLVTLIWTFLWASLHAQITPNYKAWNQVKIGMTEQELIELLGPPEHGMRMADNPDLKRADHTTQWTYWTLYPRSKVFPGGLYFSIFMTQGKVASKRDPHYGTNSDGGVPAAPKLLLPANKGSFSTGNGHIIDLRWAPPAGTYPMEYDVEVDLSARNESSRWFKQNHTTVAEPYLAVVRGGSQPHRWRVRGRNSSGVGEWSEYFYFDVTDNSEQADASNHSPRVTPVAEAPVAPRSDGR